MLNWLVLVCPSIMRGGKDVLVIIAFSNYACEAYKFEVENFILRGKVFGGRKIIEHT